MSLEAPDKQMPGVIRKAEPMCTGVAQLPDGRRVGWFASPADRLERDGRIYIIGTLLTMDGTKVLVDAETGETSLLPGK